MYKYCNQRNYDERKEEKSTVLFTLCPHPVRPTRMEYITLIAARTACAASARYCSTLDCQPRCVRCRCDDDDGGGDGGVDDLDVDGFGATEARPPFGPDPSLGSATEPSTVAVY